MGYGGDRRMDYTGPRISSSCEAGRGPKEGCLERLGISSGREVRERNTKSQTPSSREMPESKHQTPSSKHQRSSKLQVPSSKREPRFGAWYLGFFWSLELGF